MQALIDTEGTTPARSERLAGAYNRGYRGCALTYRICTASAAEATARYLKEGETLSRGIARPLRRLAADLAAISRDPVNLFARCRWRALIGSLTKVRAIAARALPRGHRRA